jgi:hypothetical protein
MTQAEGSIRKRERLVKLVLPWSKNKACLHQGYHGTRETLRLPHPGLAGLPLAEA